MKSKWKELEDNESIFHKSAHQYYENRPDKSLNQDKIHYHAEELDSKSDIIFRRHSCRQKVIQLHNSNHLPNISKIPKLVEYHLRHWNHLPFKT